MATATPTSYIDEMALDIRNRYLSSAKKLELLNRANDRFAAFAPWRWLCFHEDPVALDGSQEYAWTPSETHVNVPLIYLEMEGTFKILTPVTSVPTTSETKGLPSLFSVFDDSGSYKIRFWPRPPAGLDGNFMVIGKRAHTRVTSGNTGSNDILHFPDAYSHVFKAFLLSALYAASRLSDSSQFVTDGRGMKISGPEAEARAYALELAQTESMMFSPMG